MEAREKKRTRQDLLCSLISLKPLSVAIKTAEIPIYKVEGKEEEVGTGTTGSRRRFQAGGQRSRRPQVRLLLPPFLLSYY